MCGCEDTKSDPAKNGGKGQSNQTQVDLKEKEDIDEKALKALMKYGLHEAAKVGVWELFKLL